MGLWLRQSTAVTIKLGPFLDSTDGVTAETGLTIAQADVRLSKNGGDYAQKNEATSATHDELGEYDVPLDTTDTNTLGRLKIVVAASGAIPVWKEFMVVPANVYDALIAGSDNLEVDTVAVSGDSVAADNLEADYDGTGYNKSASTIGTTTTNSDMRGTDNAALASVCTEARLSELDAATAGKMANQVDIIEADTTSLNDTKVPDTISLANINAEVDTALTDYGANTTTPPTAAAIRAEIDANSTQLAAILADTNELQTDWANSGRLDVILDAIKAVTDNLPNSGQLTDLATAANLAIIDGLIDTLVARIPDTVSLTNINAQVVDALATDTYAEPGSVPSANVSLADKINWLFALARNKITQTSTTMTLRNDADDADIATATVSDDGSTATRGEFS